MPTIDYPMLKIFKTKIAYFKHFILFKVNERVIYFFDYFHSKMKKNNEKNIYKKIIAYF